MAEEWKSAPPPRPKPKPAPDPHADFSAFAEYVAERASEGWKGWKLTYGLIFNKKLDGECGISRAHAIAFGAVMDHKQEILAPSIRNPLQFARTLAWRSVNDQYKAWLREITLPGAPKERKQSCPAPIGTKEITVNGELHTVTVYEERKAKGWQPASRRKWTRRLLRICSDKQARKRNRNKESDFQKWVGEGELTPLDRKWAELVRAIEREKLEEQAVKNLELLSDEESIALAMRYGVGAPVYGLFRQYHYGEIGWRLHRTTKQAQRLVQRAVLVLRESLNLEPTLTYLCRDSSGKWTRKDRLSKPERFATLVGGDGGSQYIRIIPTTEDAIGKDHAA